MQVPTEDRFLMKKTELLNKVATLLGGRASEEIVFGDISTGAHNDLAKASDIARSMVREYGMSKKVGQVYFSREKRPLFLEATMAGGVEYSEATAEIIDKEIKEIVSEQYERALEILRGKRGVLDRGAAVLLEKEKIDGEQLRALMDSEAQNLPEKASA
jgi:cell division protease FtsH